MHHAQAEHLLAGRAPLIEYLEQHHVPPVDQKQHDQQQAIAQVAQQAEQQAEHQ